MWHLSAGLTAIYVTLVSRSYCNTCDTCQQVLQQYMWHLSTGFTAIHVTLINTSYCKYCTQIAISSPDCLCSLLCIFVCLTPANTLYFMQWCHSHQSTWLYFVGEKLLDFILMDTVEVFKPPLLVWLYIQKSWFSLLGFFLSEKTSCITRIRFHACLVHFYWILLMFIIFSVYIYDWLTELYPCLTVAGTTIVFSRGRHLSEFQFIIIYIDVSLLQ